MTMGGLGVGRGASRGVQLFVLKPIKRVASTLEYGSILIKDPVSKITIQLLNPPTSY